MYDMTPGLTSDKLKAVLEFVWQCLKGKRNHGVIFAYDEAQNLSDHASKDEYPLSLLLDVFQSIIDHSGGYPYFVQFLCHELVDQFLQVEKPGPRARAWAMKSIIRKLDGDFFAGRWARTTDRQRELLSVIARLPDSEGEFTLQEVAEKSKELLPKPFSTSHISQMFRKLASLGLIYKNRHGKYSYAVPLLGRFIRRQEQ